MAFETQGESNRYRPTYDPVEDAAILAELTPQRYAERVNAELERLSADPEFATASPATRYILAVALWKESNAEWDAVPVRATRNADGELIVEEDGSYLYSRASNAFGGFQIMPSNWESLVTAHPELFPPLPEGVAAADHNFRADPRYWEPEVQARGAFVLSADDQRRYRNAFDNRNFQTDPLDGGEVYGLHFHGVTTMRSLVGESEDALLSDVLSANVLAANASIRLPESINAERPYFADWTVAELTDWRQQALEQHVVTAVQIAITSSPEPQLTAINYVQAVISGEVRPAANTGAMAYAPSAGALEMAITEPAEAYCEPQLVFQVAGIEINANGEQVINGTLVEQCIPLTAEEIAQAAADRMREEVNLTIEQLLSTDEVSPPPITPAGSTQVVTSPSL